MADEKSATVVLELTERCVQTAARREHGRLVDRLMRSDADGGPDEERLELLADFLSATDFPRLRAERPELAGGTPVTFTLWRDEAGELCWAVSATS